MRSKTEPERMRSEPVEIPVSGGALLKGELTLWPSARGLVIFAHGSGSGARSPRSVSVSHVLHSEGLATLLFDLLTAGEQEETALRFDTELLTARLLDAVAWAGRHPAACRLPLGLFGASTGAAAALRAAARLNGLVQAVVCRGGRTDLAGDTVREVVSPTLLIVGARDCEVLELNRRTLSELRCEKRLAIVPGASHLFEEPGALEGVAALAAAWLSGHLAASGRPPTATAGERRA